MPSEIMAVAIMIAGYCFLAWGVWPRLLKAAPCADVPQPAPAAPPPPRPEQRRHPRPLTWRRLALAPDGFDDAIGAGDWALGQGHLTAAAIWYGDAERRAQHHRAIGFRYFLTEAFLRMNVLTGLCLCPPKDFHRVAPGERWQALHELATQGFLSDYQPAIVRLGSMLYRAHRNSEDLGPEGRAAWKVLLACRKLSPQALTFLDGQLLDEGLWRLRAALATHPSATRDLWLSMLKYAKTPDLVSTIWEITGAAEDEEVKAALTAG